MRLSEFQFYNPNFRISPANLHFYFAYLCVPLREAPVLAWRFPRRQIFVANSACQLRFRALYAKTDSETENKEGGGKAL